MPVVMVHIFPRTQDEMKKVAKAFTEDLQKICNIKPEYTHIVFADYSRDHWAWGGHLYSERELVDGTWSEPKKS